MLIHHRRRSITAHGHKAAPKKRKNVGITVHGKPGAHMHKAQLPGFVRQDVWKRQGEAQGQG